MKARSIKASARLALILAAGPLLYVLAAVLGALAAAPGQTRPDGPVTVHLLAGPIHTDILLPLDDATRARFAAFGGPDLPLGHPGADWLIAGWGARDFYTTTATWRDLSLRATLRAVAGDASVLRLGLAGAIEPGFSTWAVQMDTATYDRLIDAILATASRDAEGDPIPVDHPGFSTTDAFFEATGRFHLLRTCNAWVGAILRQSGLRFGAWTPLPLSVRIAHRTYLSP